MVTKSFSSKYLNNDQVTSEKYLYISNVKFTMKGCPENFVIFWCFSVHDMNHMWFEFRSSPTTPSWFFTEKSKKYTQYLTVLTNKNIWHKIWLILHHPKKFEHNWIKNGPAVRFYFWTLFANLNFLNFIACAIVQWWVCGGAWLVPTIFSTYLDGKFSQCNCSSVSYNKSGDLVTEPPAVVLHVDGYDRLSSPIWQCKYQNIC